MPSIDYEELFRLDKEDLLFEFGKLIASRQLVPLRREECIDNARKWFLNNHNKVKKLVCTERMARCFALESRAKTRIELVAAIVDAVSALITGVAAATLAVILIRSGLNEFCGENWGIDIHQG